MAAYCGAIGSVNVLEFVSTDLFDESQENPFLLQHHGTAGGNIGAYGAPSGSSSSSPQAKLRGSPAPSPLRKQASVRFAELPLDDPNESSCRAPSPTKMSTTWSPPTSSPNTKRQSAVVVPTPVIHHTAPPPTSSFASYAPPPPPAPMAYDTAPAYAPPTSPVPASRPSITITLPLGGGFPRQTSTDSNASTASILAEEAELHKLLYSLTQLGLGQQQQQLQQPPVAPTEQTYQQPQQQYVHDSYVSAPTSPQGYNASSLWLPSAATAPDARASSSSQQTGTASLMFRPLPSRQSRRMTARQSKAARRYSSAPNSPGRDSSPEGFFHTPADDSQAYGDNTYGSYGGGSQASSPQQRSRGSVTFLTVKNLLRGGGALARTVRREQPNRRPTCMGTELTISSRLKRREKFQRPTVITDAYHRVSDMKLGTSPMKVKVKHKAFPELQKIDGHDPDDHEELDPGMPSPKGRLHRESLITLETLDKIGTRHACPVQLIEEPLPDFSDIQPRVDAWNHYKKPKKNLRRPSAWLLGATATMTPHDLQE